MSRDNSTKNDNFKKKGTKGKHARDNGGSVVVGNVPIK
jgi:hypothetical protein